MAFWTMRVLLLALFCGLMVGSDSPVKRPSPNPGTSSQHPSKKSKVGETFVEKFRKMKIPKGGIPTELVAPFLGHGGTYESVQPWASKRYTIEADHAPHYSILDYVDTNNKDVPDKIRGAVEERKMLKEKLAETGQRLETIDGEMKKGDNPDSLQKERDEAMKLFKEQSKELNRHDNNFKKAMGVLSIPYEKHRTFPTTRSPGEEIEKLKTVDDKAAKAAMELYDKTWSNEMRKGIEKGYFNQGDKFATRADDGSFFLDPDGKKIYDYQKLWEANFDDIIAQSSNKDDKSEYMKNIHKSYAKIFRTKKWSADMRKGIEMGYFNDADKFAKRADDGSVILDHDGKKIYDYQKLWEANFDDIIAETSNKDDKSAYLKSPQKLREDIPNQEWSADIRKGIDKGYFNDADKFAKRADDGSVKTSDYHKLLEANFDEIISQTSNKDDKSAYMKSIRKSYAKIFQTKKWSADIRKGIDKGYFNDADKFAKRADDGSVILDHDGKKIYDYEKLWEANFDEINKSDYMKNVRKSYAERFLTKTIYYVKTPKEGCGRLMNLYIAEYRIYLKNDFDSYKPGIYNLLQANSNFGWLTPKDIKTLQERYQLSNNNFRDHPSFNEWKEVEELIEAKRKASKNPLAPGNSADSGRAASHLATAVCSSSASTRKKRDAQSDGCIFFSKKGHKVDSDPKKNQKNPDISHDFDDGLSSPRIPLPSDADTVSIDSKRLNNYLSQMDDGDINSVKDKQAIVEYVSRNTDKLQGTPEDIAKTRALIKHENLDSHFQQASLASKALRNSADIFPKALSQYQKVKTSSSKIAAKAGKFTSTSEKVSGTYGKIMLAKAVTTAISHGDYESLALIGGRIGLEFGLQAVAKLGGHIAKKATTKFATKLGTQVMGKMGGPVGAVANIGLSVYSIVKHVKLLNNPSATRFDQNDAIADIVADSVDIALTATAAVLSLVFPPLAPVFAAVAFIVNIFAMLTVAFFKAANHVERVNNEMPLLDYERKNEYWRYMGGLDTSGYIQGLIDTKRANNIAVNLTTQFLASYPDFIGKVFPSRTMDDPEPECALEESFCTYLAPQCSDWKSSSKCNGPGASCKNSLRKCESGSEIVKSKLPWGYGYTPHYVKFRCQCRPPPAWGYEVPDSVVDFSVPRDVYLERAAPDFNECPVMRQYLCKPGSLAFKGDRVSQQNKAWDYVCQGAIGVSRRGPFDGFVRYLFRITGHTKSNSSAGKFMLYDLGTGNDRITLSESETVDNIFIVKDGHKSFSGNAGDDSFRLDGPCDSISGFLHGKGYKTEGNSLVLGEDCAQGRTLLVDLPQHKMNFGTEGANVEVWDIHRVIGRKEMTEIITADCDTKLIASGGGLSPIYPDQVIVPACGDMTDPKMSIVGMGSMEVRSSAERGHFVIYIRIPSGHDLYFKSAVLVTNATTFNFPIQTSAHKLRTYELDIRDEADFKVIEMKIKNKNDEFINLIYKFDLASFEPKLLQNVNALFVDEEFNSAGNILIDVGSEELSILHVLETSGGYPNALKWRGGAVGAKNIFRLHSGRWEAFGGVLDDSFILNDGNFRGNIHGRGGINSLILTDTVTSDIITVNLAEKVLSLDGLSEISVHGIQTVVGRKGSQEKVTCTCDTKLVMLEGGGSSDKTDVIEILESFCHPQISFVLDEFTRIDNRQDKGGNFTYHIRTDKNFDIKYSADNLTKHEFKFEMPLSHVKNIVVNGSHLEISFQSGVKSFPLGFQNLPTFQIVQGPELFAELVLEEGQLPRTSVIARSQFSGSISRLNGTENEIVVETDSDLQSIIGGDKDDTIFLSRVRSIHLIDGEEGANRIQLEEELHQGKMLEVDFLKERITFLDDSTPFVTLLTGVTLFNGREDSFERVILGCNTAHVRYADEIIIQKNCGYNVRVEVGVGTRVIFEVEEEGEDEEDDEEADEDDDDPEYPDLDDELELLQPSTFYYHFSSIQSFDIEVDSFSRLAQTRHIFYLNFTLSDLSSLRFSLNASRLIYSPFNPTQEQLEFSHLVAEPDPASMFYSQPEFMTAEGFLLRISRYGEIIAVANSRERLELGLVQEKFIPRLSAYSSQLNISFMLETGSDFIYCGSPSEINLLTNRENVRSHLIGFNQTTYDILGLDGDVFIYPQRVLEDSLHVLDLMDVISHIRNLTGRNYVPDVSQAGSNFEIRITNWTDLFPGKVVLVNGTVYRRNLAILLNSIAMEILPKDDSATSAIDDNEASWVIRPRPILIPEGHVYLLAAEDLEDGAEIRKEVGADNDSSTFEYAKDGNDLVITSLNQAELEKGSSTSFIIFDYYNPQQASAIMESTGVSNAGKFGTVNNIHIRLGSQAVKISSNEPILSEETGEEIFVEFYEDILDREEAEILKDFPEVPRKFQVSWMTKIGRMKAYRNGLLLAGGTLLVGGLVWQFCRKKSVKGKYLVEEQQKQMNSADPDQKDMERLMEPQELITGIKLREVMEPLNEYNCHLT